MTTDSTEALRDRRRMAEEWLMESSSWRDNLDDIQAQRLMNQARDYVNQKVAETAVLGDDEAEELIDGVVSAVLRVMRDIDNLTPNLGQLDETSAREQLQKFSSDLAGISLPPISNEQVDELLAESQLGDNQSIFDRLTKQFLPQSEEDPLEEEE